MMNDPEFKSEISQYMETLKNNSAFREAMAEAQRKYQVRFQGSSSAKLAATGCLCERGRAGRWCRSRVLVPLVVAGDTWVVKECCVFRGSREGRERAGGVLFVQSWCTARRNAIINTCTLGRYLPVLLCFTRALFCKAFTVVQEVRRSHPYPAIHFYSSCDDSSEQLLQPPGRPWPPLILTGLAGRQPSSVRTPLGVP